MGSVPRISNVKADAKYHLEVTFSDGTVKDYDCGPLLNTRPEFRLLNDVALFRAVKVDAGGYGVSWNDDLDLSEYELWTNGRNVRSSRAA